MQQINKKRHESRSICTAPVTAEQVCFPLAEQAALLLRQTEGRKDELVALITSLEPSRLDARNWLRLNRDHWGIESGLHQRLDISHNDDRCRVRKDNAMLVLGMMLRLCNCAIASSCNGVDISDAQTMSPQPIPIRLVRRPPPFGTRCGKERPCTAWHLA